MVQPDSGRAELLGEDCRRAAARDASPHRLPGRGASALRLDDDRRRGAIHARRSIRAGTTRCVDQILDHFELPRRQKFRRLSQRPAGPGVARAGRGARSGAAVLDDPTLGLDTVVRRDFLESLIQIIQRQGRTILFSSHILGDVERVADRIGIMVDGVLRVDCPTETFRESVRKLCWSSPATRRSRRRCQGWSAARQSATTWNWCSSATTTSSARRSKRSAAVDRGARFESGRRVHRIHPRAAAVAAPFCNGARRC